MTTLLLGFAGQALGSALLPAGVTLFGQTISGAEIGGAIGALAGSAVDGLLSGSARVEGPRLSELHVQASTPGAPVPRVWGAMRLAGQVIWAAQFKETRERHGGGKSGARVSEYTYTASFAVGLCEGVIGGVGRVWADGKPMALDGVTMRVHPGAEDELPDPLIETVEGTAPAYRALAYVVFENLPLEPFGNRVPQLSFEVFRPVEDGDAGALERCVQAVCLIPGAGEFALETAPVLRDIGRGAWRAENVNNRTGRADIEASLDQMQAALPNVKRVALVVTWFGDDLRCGECRIRPGVELAEKRTHPVSWSVAGVERADAYVVSASEGRPNFGGTPSDASVVAAIESLRARGMEVTLYPFVMMDVPEGNGLPDPYGGAEQAAFPWRGRVTCHPAPGEAGSPDRSGAAAAQVNAFFEGEWGLRRMVLHYAALAAEAGGVDAFLIGSELRGVTTVRSAVSSYPAVARLRALAADVRGLLPDAAISYAADWTEWFGHDAADGSGDFHFHLDPLWADANIDFIGIDQYAPLSDWRDGSAHLDYGLSASGRGDDAAYLKANVEGGERFDWFYADDADRSSQTRTPIADGAYGKPWVFRAKDIRAWWSNAHVDRPGGVEVRVTAWVPESKPVRFAEIGVPAVDKGTNQPNVFYDPRSSESALPYFSSGVRDDLAQRRGLEALIGHWRAAGVNPVSSVYGAGMIDMDRAHVWAWDSRPFPDWPLREDVWADGALWRVGHWLNGRAGVAPLGALVREICAYAGVGDVDVSGLHGACAGYVVDRAMSAREALSPLMTAFAFEAAESAGMVRFFHRDAAGETALEAGDLAEPEEGGAAAASVLRAETAALPVAAKVSYIDPLADYRVDAVEARLNAGPSVKLERLTLPLALSRAEAGAVAARVLHEAWTAREQISFALPPALLRLEPGDAVGLEGRSWRLTRVSEGGRALAEAGRLERHLYEAPAPALEGRPGEALPVFGPPVIVALDLAPIAFGGGADGLRLAVFADPWPGALTVTRGPSVDGALTEIAEVSRRAVVGETVSVLGRGPANRWDRVNWVDVVLYGGGLAAASERAVLDGANRAALETTPGVWEAIQFAGAELVAPETWRLSMLLRGQAGSEDAVVDALEAGARFVLLDEAVIAPPVGPEAAGDLVLLAGPVGAPLDAVSAAAVDVAYAARGRRPWSPCQLRALRSGGDVTLSWIRRARDDGGLWSELEVGLGEEAERYVCEVMDGADAVRRFEVDDPGADYSAAMQVEDWGGAAPLPLTIRVAQVSPRFGSGVAAVGAV